MSKAGFSGNEIVNLRDLGGYVGHDGRRVKGDLLYRSGNLDQPEDVLADILESLGISLVFDLRSSEEVENQPYTLPADVQYRHRPVLDSFENGTMAASFELGDMVDLALRGGRSLSPGELDFLRGFMQQVYREMGENARVFGDIMKEMIGNGENPVLFHCSAGKDRTGVLATMILLALGVSMEDAMENYLMSNQHREEEIDREMRAVASFIREPEILEHIKGLMLVKEEYLDAAMGPARTYPSFDAFAESRLGLGPDDLETLRELYLE
ncbi:MAG TPA: tyrosine-protein phosphatase [Bacillota bacterium]|jgi:protein-tyrosine phosphatase|nr:tyrosine-protein phosphatase [Fastidiosipila sp.]HPX92588.1 tyrosine-protein phosphatase [Bacillota bacterium]HQB81144.1 tyrosine-protein phosphatase [Bacillota bacterium]